MFIIFRKKKIVENTYLNPLIDTMDFICIKINFSIHILQVLSHKTHCCRHKLYLFRITLHIVANFPNRISSLIYYNDHTMAIYIHFCTSTAKFSMLNSNQFLIAETINNFLLPFLKGSIGDFNFKRDGNNILVKGMMTTIHILTRWFISDDTNKWIIKSEDICS